MLAYPVPIELKEERPETLPVGAAALARPLQNYFGALAQHYSSLLAATARDAQMVSELGDKAVYLIDADVIRNLAQVRYKDSRLQRESSQLFDSPQFQYAIPLGAFYELIEWMRSFVPNRIMWSEDSVSSRTMNREETVRELALAFDVPSEEDPTQAVERIFALIARHKPIVERLVELFNRPNFRGVVGDFELVDVAQLHRILGQLERHFDVPESRERRDYRDCVNLAIVCYSRSRAGRAVQGFDENPSYVLVTQTDPILDLVVSENSIVLSWAVLKVVRAVRSISRCIHVRLCRFNSPLHSSTAGPTGF